MPGRGTERFSREMIFGQVGVLALDTHRGPCNESSRRRMQQIRMSGLMCRDIKQGDSEWPMPLDPSSTLLSDSASGAFVSEKEL